MIFFFFKQKTAYEISLGLVGSEMCIRDRSWRTALLGRASDSKPIRILPTAVVARSGVQMATENLGTTSVTFAGATTVTYEVATVVVATTEAATTVVAVVAAVAVAADEAVAATADVAEAAPPAALPAALTARVWRVAALAAPAPAAPEAPAPAALEVCLLYTSPSPRDRG